MTQTISKQVLEDLLKKVSPTPVSVVRELSRAGFEAYIVGGAVRDLLLGKTPKDYDISTSATPEEVRKVFGRRRCHVIGRRFRLAHVYAGGDIYEVSTFRRTPNEKERQGRKHEDGPIIWNDNCFGTLEDDVKRRDFTVNSLYLDVTGKRGVIDFTGGYQDLRDGIVRCVGEPTLRMEEDPVRMLRALKLVGQCGFRLEASLEGVIREKCQEIQLASAPRLFEELLKLLANPACDNTFQVMHETGFLKHFLPVVDEAWEEQEGVMMRHLLKLRGDAMRRGRYSNSRGLALSTMALPFLMSALNPEAPSEFWEGNAASDPVAHQALHLVFQGVVVPKLLFYRVLQIVGLVPRLLKKPVQLRFMNHAEYRYGRALVALLVQLFDWDRKLLADLPELSPRFGSQEENWDVEEREGRVEAMTAEEETAEAPSAEAFEDSGMDPRFPGLVPLVSGPRAKAAPRKDAPPPRKQPRSPKNAKTAADAAEAPVREARKRPERRKKPAARKESPLAPENSPALHLETTEGPDPAFTPVVETPPPPPSESFFKAPVFLPEEPPRGKKNGKNRKLPPSTDSITFGNA